MAGAGSGCHCHSLFGLLFCLLAPGKRRCFTGISSQRVSPPCRGPSLRSLLYSLHISAEAGGRRCSIFKVGARVRSRKTRVAVANKKNIYIYNIYIYKIEGSQPAGRKHQRQPVDKISSKPGCSNTATDYIYQSYSEHTLRAWLIVCGDTGQTGEQTETLSSPFS